MLRLQIAVAVLVAGGAALLFYHDRTHTYLVEHRVYLEKIDRRVRYALGLPLRGTPDFEKVNTRLAAAGLKFGDPIFMRIFKSEHVLELWIKKGKRFELFQTYPICMWSGRVGPKLKEGDRQAPEGFYTVGKGQLNPNSRWLRSFNLGYPNLFDRSHKRTGSYLMVHGGCGSIGCYAMTNPAIMEIWAFVTKALKGGQTRFHVHAFPFRMTDWNMKLHQKNKWSPFWRDMKKAYDLFEKTSVPPVVTVCDGRYAVRQGELGSNGSLPVRTLCAAKTAKNGR